jgi:hypothetical protein
MRTSLFFLLSIFPGPWQPPRQSRHDLNNLHKLDEEMRIGPVLSGKVRGL